MSQGPSFAEIVDRIDELLRDEPSVLRASDLAPLIGESLETTAARIGWLFDDGVIQGRAQRLHAPGEMTLVYEVQEPRIPEKAREAIRLWK